MRRYIRHIPYILFILTLGFIWVNSLLPGETSGQLSEFVLRLLGFGGTGAGNGVIRKIAHGLEFTALGAELAVIGCMRGWKVPGMVLSGLAICFIDESIQLFVPGRYGCIADMWIDLGGCITGILITVGIVALSVRRKMALPGK